MYKGTSQNQQRRVDFISPADLAGGDEIQSVRDQRRNYKRALREIDLRIVASDPRSEERRALGMEKRRLADEMAALPGNEPMKADLGEILIDELRQMLPVPQYRIALDRARQKFEAGLTKNELDVNKLRVREP